MRSFMQISNSIMGKRDIAQPFYEPADQPAHSKTQDVSSARPEKEYTTEPEVRAVCMGRGKRRRLYDTGHKSKGSETSLFSLLVVQLVLAMQ